MKTKRELFKYSLLTTRNASEENPKARVKAKPKEEKAKRKVIPKEDLDHLVKGKVEMRQV